MSLYDALDVPADADGDAIRRAHRKPVRKHHPDAGGNREDFERVQHAYLILRDPKTRERYDATGDETIAPDNELSEIANLIVGCFDEATSTCQGQWEAVDLVAKMRAALGQRLRNAREAHANLVMGAGVMEKIAKRLSYKGDGTDLIGGMLASRLADNRRAQAAVMIDIANIERAQAYAADYGYAFDPKPPLSPLDVQKSAFDQQRNVFGNFFR